MKKLYTLVLLLLPFLSFSQNVDSVWLVNNYIKKEVHISMRDGVKLSHQFTYRKTIQKSIPY